MDDSFEFLCPVQTLEYALSILSEHSEQCQTFSTVNVVLMAQAAMYHELVYRKCKAA